MMFYSSYASVLHSFRDITIRLLHPVGDGLLGVYLRWRELNCGG